MRNLLMSVPMLTILLASPVLAASEGEPSLFAGTIAQSIAAVAVFMVLFAVLYRAAWGPILKGLQEREEHIKADLLKAETAAKQAEATLKEYQQQLAQAREQASRIMDTARRDAEQLAASIQEETRKELDAMKKRMEAEIRYAKELAVQELYKETAVLATHVAGKILHREINPQDQETLVRETLAAIKPGELN